MTGDTDPRTAPPQDELATLRKRFRAVRRVADTLEHTEDCPGEEDASDCDCLAGDLLRAVAACGAASPEEELEELRMFVNQLRQDLDNMCHGEDCEADDEESDCTCALGPLRLAIDPPKSVATAPAPTAT